MAESAHGMTSGAVARRLGVAPTTLRSWDRRYGIGPAIREHGRHRRWTPADVAVLQEMCRLTASGVPPAEAARAARAARSGAVSAPLAGPEPRTRPTPTRRRRSRPPRRDRGPACTPATRARSTGDWAGPPSASTPRPWTTSWAP
ncbi:MerR family transcriptional regulator [Streptomyces sp. MS1.HAVA.3]|uniref:MerR family transcriptional regulator n=1 Tax=Streptomyces caledonius TaxID=3134107 RepID=A0ABU8U2I6_9ACTN